MKSKADYNDLLFRIIKTYQNPNYNKDLIPLVRESCEEQYRFNLTMYLMTYKELKHSDRQLFIKEGERLGLLRKGEYK